MKKKKEEKGIKYIQKKKFSPKLKSKEHFERTHLHAGGSRSRRRREKGREGRLDDGRIAVVLVDVVAVAVGDGGEGGERGGRGGARKVAALVAVVPAVAGVVDRGPRRQGRGRRRHGRRRGRSEEHAADGDARHEPRPDGGEHGAAGRPRGVRVRAQARHPAQQNNQREKKERRENERSPSKRGNKLILWPTKFCLFLFVLGYLRLISLIAPFQQLAWDIMTPVHPFIGYYSGHISRNEREKINQNETNVMSIEKMKLLNLIIEKMKLLK